jgi:glycerophosphoryl diester phosphodiesterase
MKDTKWIIDGLFAHRGLHNDVYPENTLGAFKHAVEKNYDVECDIQLTSDEKIVVFHDKNLKRLCGVDKIVEECTYEELQKCRINKTNETIPLLSDMFNVLPQNTKLLIEFKPTKRHEKIVSMFLEYMKGIPNIYAIHSFDPRIILDFKLQAPDVIRGIISENFSLKEYGLKGKIAGNLLLNRKIKPDFINYGFKDLPRKQLDRLMKKGMIILSYTARSQSDLDFVRSKYHNAVFENFEAK